MSKKRYLEFKISIDALIPLDEVDFSPDGNIKSMTNEQLFDAINDGHIDFDWATEVKRAEEDGGVDVQVYDIEVRSI